MVIKINKPNHIELRNISDSEYFSSKYSDWISNSKLGLINPDEDGSPQKFKEGLSQHVKVSDALSFGSAIHSLVLQPNEFYLVDTVDKPSGKPGMIADYLISNNLELNDINILKGAKEFDYFKGELTEKKLYEVQLAIQGYYDALKNNGIQDYVNETQTPIFLSSYDRYRCGKCLSSIMLNGQIQKLLYPKSGVSHNEATILLDLDVNVNDKVVNLKFKGKIDNFTIIDNKLTLNDLKTTSKEPSEFYKSFRDFHYARQLSIYLYFLKCLYPEVSEFEANIITITTKDSFVSDVLPISLKSINEGLHEAANLIKRVAFHEVYGYDKCIEDYE